MVPFYFFDIDLSLLLCCYYNYITQITHPSQSGLKVGDTIPVVVLGPDRRGRPSLSRKMLLPRLFDSGDGDDDVHRPAVEEKTSTHEQQPQQVVNQAFDGLTTADVSSSQTAELASDSASDSSSTVTRPVGGDELTSDSTSGSATVMEPVDDDDCLVSDSKSDSTTNTVTQTVGDADLAPKTVRARFRGLYDRWFGPSTVKRSSSESVRDDTSGKSNSKTSE